MNLPENLSPDAARLYELIAADASGQSIAQLSEAFSSQPTAEGSPKAIATANSLVVKGIINKEEADGKTVYAVSNPPEERKTDKENGEETYTEGEPATNSANAEEQRMIDLLEKSDGKLSEAALFEQYDKEQQPDNGNDSTTNSSKTEAALQELTEAGMVTKEGDSYSKKN